MPSGFILSSTPTHLARVNDLLKPAWQWHLASTLRTQTFLHKIWPSTYRKFWKVFSPSSGKKHKLGHFRLMFSWFTGQHGQTSAVQQRTASAFFHCLLLTTRTRCQIPHLPSRVTEHGLGHGPVLLLDLQQVHLGPNSIASRKSSRTSHQKVTTKKITNKVWT